MQLLHTSICRLVITFSIIYKSKQESHLPTPVQSNLYLGGLKMLKSPIIIFILLILISPSSMSASPIPDSLNKSLNSDLQNQRQQIDILLNQDEPKHSLHTANETSTKYQLGDGYETYTIYLPSNVASENLEFSSTDASLLRSVGYLFLIEKASLSVALAFTDNNSKNEEIIGVASSEDFSDADFKIPMEKAKQLVGFNSSSKLIYDEGHRTIALVAITDQGEKVAMLQDSSPLGLKRYDVLSFQELIEKVQHYEVEQSKMAYLNNEPTSGGAGGSSTGNGGAGNLQNLANTSTISPYIWSVSVIVLIGIGVLSYVIYRKRKPRSLSN